MGNDNSRLKGLIIDKKAIEVTEFWTLNDAQLPTTSNEEGIQYLSIFQEEPFVDGKLWSKQSPLTRVINNLKIYRHPYILRYVNTWEQGGQKFLATERVRPLTSVLKTLSDIEICIGLRTILCSLIFLVEKASARHLNLRLDAIYVTDNGAWRLAGFEYVWKVPEITDALLKMLKVYRNKSSVDAKERSEISARNKIEQYAFANFCEDIFRNCQPAKDDVLEHVQEFRQYCSTQLKNENSELRPSLSQVLEHCYFNNELVHIHCFLYELPAKSVTEKQNFFKNLIARLRNFNEDTIGKHLAAELISHMVLLDSTAQVCVTPYVMRTKNSDAQALFSISAYKQYLLPHIKKMFRMRDAQIRLIMLEYFLEYVRLLDDTELREYILPNLTSGMNDINDVLVSKTMHCLADLVPILGAATVVGEPRSRLFADGRPQANTTTHCKEPRSITPVMEGHENEFMVSNSPLNSTAEKFSELSPANSLPSLSDLDKDSTVCEKLSVAEDSTMPPRMSPDGGEDEDDSNIVIDTSLNEKVEVVKQIEKLTEDEQWSDWETDDKQETTQITTTIIDKKINLNYINDDINAFDLQIKKSTSQQQHLEENESNEFDFFKDMEPTIKFNTKEIGIIQNQKAEEEEKILVDVARFAITNSGIEDNTIEIGETDDGWGIDDSDVDVNVA